jgi:hypothetical protein
MTQLDEPCELEEDGRVTLRNDEAIERGKECVYGREEEGEGEGVEVDLLLKKRDELKEISWVLELSQRANILTMRRQTKKKSKKDMTGNRFNTL